MRGTQLLLARTESRNAAAGGRERHCGISAAVGESEDQRKPERFSGHRKAAETSGEHNDKNPPPFGGGLMLSVAQRRMVG